jgi:hypothetical protein
LIILHQNNLILTLLPFTFFTLPDGMSQKTLGSGKKVKGSNGLN